ncbi:MAG: EAL domain-containing protein [Desulfuromusa sp.]|nr:EAL domain-containing protein [Desulfuromusa sp.]
MSRNKAIILISFLALVVFLGFLLSGNYRAQTALSQASFDRLKLDLEKRVATLDYFLSERRNDLQTFNTRRELAAYFINKDLGVSERYGLKVNLFVIKKLFDDALNKKNVHGNPIYSRILLVDDENNCIVDTSSHTSNHSPKMTDVLNTVKDDIQIMMLRDGEESHIVIAGPVYHKNQLRGKLLAYLSSRTILEHIVGTEPGPLTSLLITTEDLQSNLGQKSNLNLKNLSAKLKNSFEFVTFSQLLPEEGFSRSMHSMKIPLKNAAFFLLYVTPTEQIFDVKSPRKQLLTTGAMAVFLLIFSGFLLRSNVQLLVLKTRVTEEKRQNVKLQQEIDLRAEIVKELQKKQEQVEEQTAELQESVDRTHMLAYYDTLTGLPNRELCMDRIDQAIATAKRNEKNIALLFLDLDQFKHVNDTLGHACGDTLLRLVSERLRHCVREEDTIARLGGDEFIMLFSAMDPGKNVNTKIQKVLDCMIDSFLIDGQEVFITTSIGIAIFPRDGHDVFTLLKNADLAMYAAKAKGRNTYSFFSAELNQIASERREMEINLRKAIENEEFYLVYQPQYNLLSNKLVGFEALLRWQHPEKGLIPPNIFIPVAEESSLILPIGDWVLRQAVRQAKEWQVAGYPDICMAVNISARQFKQADIIAGIDSILQDAELNPSLLELELTESILMDNAGENIQILKRLKMRKIKLSIDDFGTGYSSLSYLKDFPIDRIKIDQSFIRDISKHPDHVAIIDAIIAMGASLKLEVLAEGVETLAEVEYLRERKCAFVQGYFFARPLASKDATELLAEVL